MKEIIYEKSYTREEYYDLCESAEPLNTPLTEEQHKEASEFLDQLEASLKRVPIPHRQQQAERFIKTAVHISEMYRLDLKLERREDMISATLNFDNGGGMSALGPLLAMGDDFAFFSGHHEKHNTICIDYYTHAVFRNGRLLAPLHWEFDK